MRTTASGVREQFVALAGLRGVAALVVVMWHWSRLFGFRIPGGYLGADFFFLLSGWVLAHAYDEKLATTLSGWGFVRARLIRIYPVYLLALLLTIFGWSVMGNVPFAAGLAALFLVPNFWEGTTFWLLPPSWSLTAEMSVNLPFGFLHKRLSDGVLGMVVVAALGGLIACGWLFGAMDTLSDAGVWPRLLSRAFFSFPLGVLLYRHRRLAAKAPEWSAWPAMIALIATVLIPASQALAPLRDLTCITMLLPALLLFSANARPRALTATIATALGDMSYPLYLLHPAIFAFANVGFLAFAGVPLNQAGPAFGVLLLVSSAGLAWLIDRYFDRPIRSSLARAASARLVERGQQSTTAPPGGITFD